MSTINKIVRLVAFLSLTLIFFSCLPGTRLAKKYIRMQDKPALMMMGTDQLGFINLDSARILKAFPCPAGKRDSVIYWNSQFWPYLDDSAFLADFFYALSFNLQKAGYKVFNETYWTEFLKSESSAIINIAQQEMEEYTYPYYQVGTFPDTLVYTRGIKVKGVGLSSWIELTQVNGDEPMQVMYHYTSVEDIIDGKFLWNPFVEEYPYYYSRKDISLKEVNDLAYQSGKESADLLFDFLMNRYVNSHRKEPLSDDYYLHYNRDKKRLRLAQENRLQQISP